MFLPSLARENGFTIDDTCYPWYAYKGLRFRPTEAELCLTDKEEKADLRYLGYTYHVWQHKCRNVDRAKWLDIMYEVFSERGYSEQHIHLLQLTENDISQWIEEIFGVVIDTWGPVWTINGQPYEAYSEAFAQAYHTEITRRYKECGISPLGMDMYTSTKE